MTRIKLGVRKDDLPANSSELTPAQMIRFTSRFFKAKPDLITEIKSRVDFQDGRPRTLTVETLLGGMLAAGMDGSLHVTQITRKLRTLGIGQQRALGVRWKNADGTYGLVTHRQIDYLITQIVNAYSPGAANHDHPVHFEEEGLLVDTVTGEVLGAYEDLDERARESSVCSSQCAWAITAESLGNKLLSDLWDYLGIPQTTSHALDSYPIPTHFASKSYGAMSDIDPENMPEDMQHLASTVSDSSPAPKRTKGEKGKKWVVKKTTTSVQKAIMAASHENWRKKKKAKRSPKSRAIQLDGPRAEGSFVRRDSRFPIVARDLRLQHSFDEGAGDTFRGAGSSRSSEIVHGRDKHTLVTTGALPDGTPYPAFLVSYNVSKGGNNKTSAAICTMNYADGNGANIEKLYLDRGYTNVSADRLLIPAIDRGIDLIRDLNSHHRKIRQWAPGIDLIDGYWFADGLPLALRDIEMHGMQASLAEKKKSQALFDKRAKFAFRPMGPRRDGKMRYRGPSAGSVVKNKFGVVTGFTGATARCVNSIYFEKMNRTLPKTKCRKGDDCSCSKTILINMKDLPGSYEPLLYGTTKWAKAKGNRSVVESYNSIEQIQRNFNRHSIQVHARKWDFIHALLNAALFIQLFYNWVVRLGAWAVHDYHPLDRPVVKKCMELVSTPATPAESPPHSP
jgi:hypothetical protein